MMPSVRAGRVGPSLGALVWLAGCTTPDPPAATVFRDSAGVAIAESDPSVGSLPQWTVGPEPSLEIGVVDGDSTYQFHDIRGVARLADGRIVVANRGTAELRSYSADGEHLRTVGRAGDGPGEYRFLYRLLRLSGDSIVAADAMQYRLSLYDSTLALVRSWATPPLGPFTAPPPLGRFADGRWLTLASRTIGEVPGDVVFAGALVAYDLNVRLDTIAELPGPRARLESCGPDGRAICNLGSRFPAVTRVAVAPDRIFAGNGEDGFEVRVFDASGRIAALWRAAVSPRSVTDREIEQDRRSLLASVEGDEARRRLDAEYDRTPMPDVMPAYSNLLVDDGGDLWVEQYVTTFDPERRFLVFGPDGRLVARCVLPSRLDVRQAGADFVLGIWKDENGVEFVRRYDLDRAAGRAPD